jgi:hypothetical protein
MEALWATILFSGFALEVIIRRLKNYKKTPQSKFIYMTWNKRNQRKKPGNRA